MMKIDAKPGLEHRVAEIRRPIGVSEPVLGGGLPPPTPSALGPSPPTPETNSSIRTLYIKWFPNWPTQPKSCHAELECTLSRLSLPWNLSELGQSLYIYRTHGPQIVHFDYFGSLAQK